MTLKKFSKLIVVVVVLLLSGLTLGFRTNAASGKITVCHKPPGNVENCHEISVSLNALEAHLNHGDDLVCNDESESEMYEKIARDFLSLQVNSPISVVYGY